MRPLEAFAVIILAASLVIGWFVASADLASRGREQKATKMEVFSEKCREVGGEPVFYGREAYCFSKGGKSL